MLGGYFNKFLRVDLTNETLEDTSFDESILRKYLGGSGLGARILYDETTPETDPLGPDNVLIFLTGPTEGTRMPNAGRFQVTTRSPLTGSFGEANSGGTFGVRLKKAGYDGIIFKGCAKKPMYLHIDSGKPELLEADELWGKDTFVVDEILKEKHGKRTTTCSVGMSGEAQSLLACIMNDGEDARTAARCGVGAVMGSKNLKAISVLGDIKTPIAHEEEFNATVKKWAPLIMERMAGLREGGTSGAVPFIEEIGDLPINNWRDGNFDCEDIATPKMNAEFLSGRYSCANCAIRCGRVVTVKDGPYKCENAAGPEYETIGLFGSNCMIADIPAITHANTLCNKYGMDTIGAAGAVAFAMEAFERGILTEEMLGMKARFGNIEDMIELLHRMGRCEGFGKTLANGSKVAAEVLGGLSPEFAVVQRGMEFPAHDPRYSSAVALQYAVSPRGACHLSANTHGPEYGGSYHGYGFGDGETIELDNHSTEHKVDMNIEMETIMCLCDSMTVCKFVLDGIGTETCDMFVEWLNLITGWDLTKEELVLAGQRIFNLKRMYLVRDGQSRKDDKLPPRMKKRRGTGGSATHIPNVDGMLDEYYEKRGWDEFGIPTPEMLEKLGLAGTV